MTLKLVLRLKLSGFELWWLFCHVLTVTHCSADRMKSMFCLGYLHICSVTWAQQVLLLSASCVERFQVHMTLFAWGEEKIIRRHVSHAIVQFICTFKIIQCNVCYDLLWSVDPYYVQVAKVDTLFIHKTCAGTSLSPGVASRDWCALCCAMTQRCWSS